jgi:hypothetical protein
MNCDTFHPTTPRHGRPTRRGLRNQRTEAVCHWACGNSQVQLRVLVLTTTSVTLSADRGRRCRPARHHTGERPIPGSTEQSSRLAFELELNSAEGEYLTSRLTSAEERGLRFGRLGIDLAEPVAITRGGRAHWRSEVGLSMACPAQLAAARMTLARPVS